MNHLLVALPSGKSLQARTEQLFKDADIEMRRKSERASTAVLIGAPGFSEAIYYKPLRIPRIVARQELTVGITGMDALYESGLYGPERPLEVCSTLPYNRQTNGAIRCVLFAREDNPVFMPAPNPDSSHERTVERWLRNIPQGAKIISEYPRSTEEFLMKTLPMKVSIEPCEGSAEAEVANSSLVQIFGVALVETGATLAANGLREITEIFESSTVLIVNKKILADREMRASVIFLDSLLKGAFNARGRVMLLMNAPIARLADIGRILPSLKSPTVTPLADPAFCSVSAVVPRYDKNRLIYQLARLGADGFISHDISTVM